MKKEIWKDIEGYEGLYQVSNWGNVKSLNYRKRGYAKNLTPKINNRGYEWVELRKNGKKKQVVIHRLVGETFLENPNGYPIINHKDENKTNNTVENLEWCTLSYNTKYSMERHPERIIGLRKPRRKRNYYKTKTRYSNIHINQLTIDGRFIKQWFNMAEIKHTLNYHNTSIKECCEGKRKTAYGYKWEFAEQSVDSLFI